MQRKLCSRAVETPVTESGPVQSENGITSSRWLLHSFLLRQSYLFVGEYQLLNIC
jgi:hypothetical protein